MKKSRIIASLIAFIMVAAMLTGCLSIEMKVNSNGSCDLTYTIDTSQLQGMMTKSDVETSIKDSVDQLNKSAGKTIAKLKSVKEDKKKETITASISVTDINKMGDGAFFGTVKEYKKKNGAGLDNLVDRKGKNVDIKKVSDSLNMVYFPTTSSEDYGIIDVKVVIPGTIQYVSDGADVKSGNTVEFKNELPLVVFKNGGGFPWLLILGIILVLFLALRIKKSSNTAAQVATPIIPEAPIAVQTQVPVVSPEELPDESVVQDENIHEEPKEP